LHSPTHRSLSPCHPDPPAHVRFGSKADICAAKSDVRFAPNSDRESGHSFFTDQGAQPNSKRLQSASLANVTAA
jgi:hypothetical protein